MKKMVRFEFSFNGGNKRSCLVDPDKVSFLETNTAFTPEDKTTIVLDGGAVFVDGTIEEVYYKLFPVTIT